MRRFGLTPSEEVEEEEEDATNFRQQSEISKSLLTLLGTSMVIGDAWCPYSPACQVHASLFSTLSIFIN